VKGRIQEIVGSADESRHSQGCASVDEINFATPWPGPCSPQIVIPISESLCRHKTLPCRSRVTNTSFELSRNVDLVQRITIEDLSQEISEVGSRQFSKWLANDEQSILGEKHLCNKLILVEDLN
jgi:hypothetical protein